MSSSSNRRLHGGSRSNTRPFGNLSSSIGPPDIRGEGKKPLPNPIGIPQIALTMVLYVCRKFLLMDPQIKAGIYAIIVMFGSLFHDFFPLPELYISKKSNIFNQYFVKLGWGWTFSLCAIYIFLTSFIYTCGNIRDVKIHLSRLGVGTAVWFCCTMLFTLIESCTGKCLNAKYLDRRSCLGGGSRWGYAFDVSGHTFLLIYCNLLISEEGRTFIGWERLGEMINDSDNIQLSRLSADKVAKLKQYYAKFTSYIKGIFISLTCLSGLWEIMLCITVLYFHSLPQKLAGALFAVTSWFITYRVWFLSKNSPGLPGWGVVRYR